VSPSETGKYWWYNESNGRPPPAERGYDLLHINSVEPDGDGLIVSARHLNAVFRIDRRTGDIDWKLGGTFVPGRSLSVFGVGFQSVLYGQHDARLAGDGTLTVYDNRSYTGQPPAAVRFRIDAAARTATKIADLEVPAVRDSRWGGSARMLPGGNWVIGWGGTDLITEQTPAGKVVLSLRLGGYHQPYRAQGVPRGVVSAAALRRGMDRMAAGAGP
jgi:hypothetical protein